MASIAASGPAQSADRPRLATAPVVLVIAGHDPTGGAGLQADIEVLAAHGVHGLGLITCLTAQDTTGVTAVWPQSPTAFRQQAACLLADCRPTVIKIGALGSTGIATEVLYLLEQLAVPVVLDPVLASGAGQALGDSGLLEVLRAELIPLASLSTPNLPEAGRLVGQDPERTERVEIARALLALGDGAVLLTGGHMPGNTIVNQLYQHGAAPQSWTWPRLPGAFHGSGCTLASAIAARLALGQALETAVAGAQAYTHNALARARALGQGQAHPFRLAPGCADEPA